MCGTIVAIDGDVALVKVDRSFPQGGTITVRLGKLSARPLATDEVAVARIRRAQEGAGNHG
jgi:hypothetical protein